MRQPTPLPEHPPFITFYTPTFHRPVSLGKCMASIEQQTVKQHCEQIIVPDFVGYGITGGLYGRIKWYAAACRGQYVHILADDDVLFDERVVERLMDFAKKKQNPPVIVVDALKGGLTFPSCNPLGMPEVGEVDLGCYVLRRDIWLRHCDDYGRRYEGDFDHAVVIHHAGYQREYLNMTFVEGGASNGRPEA